MGKTIMISSHILSELNDLCNKIAIIEKGKLLHSGPLEEVVRKVQPIRRIFVGVDGDLELAKNVLLEQGVDSVTEEEGRLVVEISDNNIELSRLSQVLFKKHLSLTHFEEEEVKLEDVFMLLTEGTVG